jgi:hypothetical protein
VVRSRHLNVTRQFGPWLCESGLLLRNDCQQVPPKVEYSVTPFGRALANHWRLFALGATRTGGARWEGNFLKKRSFGHTETVRRARRADSSTAGPS